MSLGSRIKNKRKAAGLTQNEIAKQLGMGRSNFGHIENDRVVPSSEDLNKIAVILNTKADYLLNGVTEDVIDAPSWATSKDRRDFKEMLQEDATIMFDGVPLDEEDKQKLLKVMEAVFWDAKKRNKRKPIDE